MDNWTDIYDIDNVDLVNDYIESRVVGILDELCPFKNIQYRSNYKPQISAETKLKMEQRDKARELARQTGDPTNWKTYRELRNMVNKDLNTDRKSHYKDLHAKHQDNNDVSATYKAAKQQVGWKNCATPVRFLKDGRQVTNPKEMAELHMEMFHQKTGKLISEVPPTDLDPVATLQECMDKWRELSEDKEMLKLKPISKLETLGIINKLGNSTSTANDNLDAMSIKHGAAILHRPIMHVINLSITTQKFASRWKIGKLLPLHKGKGLSHKDLASFRPISLLPVIGKIIERAVQPKILDFMENTNQFNQNHHSYRKSHSTVTAMLQISDEIFQGCNNNKITTMVTLDQSSAFDVISHEILMKKL